MDAIQRTRALAWASLPIQALGTALLWWATVGGAHWFYGMGVFLAGWSLAFACFFARLGIAPERRGEVPVAMVASVAAWVLLFFNVWAFFKGNLVQLS